MLTERRTRRCDVCGCVVQDDEYTEHAAAHEVQSNLGLCAKLAKHLSGQSVHFHKTGVPVWDGPIPNTCDRDVVNAVLRLASRVATQGIGEKTAAQGFVIIIGSAEKPMIHRLWNGAPVDDASSNG